MLICVTHCSERLIGNLHWLQAFWCSRYPVMLKNPYYSIQQQHKWGSEASSSSVDSWFFSCNTIVHCSRWHLCWRPLTRVSAMFLTVITTSPWCTDSKTSLFSVNYSEWDRRWSSNVTEIHWSWLLFSDFLNFCSRRLESILSLACDCCYCLDSKLRDYSSSLNSGVHRRPFHKTTTTDNWDTGYKR